MVWSVAKPEVIHGKLCMFYISDIPIDTYDPHTTASWETFKVRDGPSCATHRPDEKNSGKAEIIEIGRRCKCDLELGVGCSFGKP